MRGDDLASARLSRIDRRGVRVGVGRLADLPDDRCIDVGDGRAIAVRVGNQLRAYQNHCLHQDSTLAGGIVRDGVLSCPFHFWRYHADDGRLVGTQRCLQSFPVDIVDGEAFVEVPDDPPPMSLRQQLLQRAADYDRQRAFLDEAGNRPS